MSGILCKRNTEEPQVVRICSTLGRVTAKKQQLLNSGNIRLETLGTLTIRINAGEHWGNMYAIGVVVTLHGDIIQGCVHIGILRYGNGHVCIP